MTKAQQPEALVFADNRPTSLSDDLYQWAIDAEDLILAQHARITELEDVADMAIKRIEELEAQLSAPQPPACNQSMQPELATYSAQTRNKKGIEQ